MATCPKCGGHLTSRHRCRVSRGRRIVDASVIALVGGVAAIAATAVFDQAQQTSRYDVLIFVAGVVLALGAHYLFEKLA